MFTGSCVAIVTPMDGDKVDYQSFGDLVEWHISAGTQALVVAGTTGESCTLTDDETIQLWKTAVECASARLPIIAGTGCNATHRTVERTKLAKSIGCDAALVITPYYNKPTQAGLFAHFEAVANEAQFPIILYNNPSRAACDMQVSTTVELSKLSNIVGIKDSTSDLLRLEALKKECQQGFKFYSGDDPSAFEFMCQGGDGVISTVGNIVPSVIATLSEAALNGDRERGSAIDSTLQPLYKLMAIESNPIPVKWALAKMGRIPHGIRLPLTWLSAEHQAMANTILDKAVGEVHA